MPLENKQVFYAALPIIHGFGAILALSLSFACGSGNAVQTARVPTSLAVPRGLSSDLAFYTAYPWDEGGDLPGNTWNPFALIFVFEWLTAGFALRTLRYFTERPDILLKTWIAWLVAGTVAFMAWALTNSGGVCPAMFASVLASFLASGALAYYALNPELRLESTPRQFERLAGEDYQDPHGRVWKVPLCVQSLRARKPLSDYEEEQTSVTGSFVDAGYENDMGVVFRYAEYCITAPLLFLAVVCLMVVDAPAWLFLTGYWFVFTCNAFGITLHIDFKEYSAKRNDGGAGPWFAKILIPGPWKDPASNLSGLLQAAWFSLLVPLGGLIFQTRNVLFSSNMPALVLILIWNLLITYSMFGIIPTIAYIFRATDKSLATQLDVLNIAAKFPIPMIILAGAITRPGTNRFCYN